MKIPIWRLVGMSYAEALEYDASEVICGECDAPVDAEEYREHRAQEGVRNDD